MEGEESNRVRKGKEEQGKRGNEQEGGGTEVRNQQAQGIMDEN